jgi:hypothetical protein
VRQVSADSYLMIALNQIDVITDLVGRGHECGVTSTANGGPAAHAHSDVVLQFAVSLNTQVGGRKKVRARADKGDPIHC